jgi:uncharacterized protein with PQ loop repeat
MHSLWWIGSAGIIAIEASYLPQIARLHRRKHADDVSIFFPALNVAGRVLALVYSLVTHDRVFIAGFMVGILLRLVLLSQVAWYRRLGWTRTGHAALRPDVAS